MIIEKVLISNHFFCNVVDIKISNIYISYQFCTRLFVVSFELNGAGIVLKGNIPFTDDLTLYTIVMILHLPVKRQFTP